MFYYVVIFVEYLLQSLFANLMSNAIYYAASNSVIAISATTISKNSAANSKDTLANNLSHSQNQKQSWLNITISNRLEKPL